MVGSWNVVFTVALLSACKSQEVGVCRGVKLCRAGPPAPHTHWVFIIRETNISIYSLPPFPLSKMYPRHEVVAV